MNGPQPLPQPDPESLPYCQHHETKIRLRLVGVAKRPQYVRQCIVCGKSSCAIKKEKAIEENGGADPLPFDDTLEAQYQEKISIALKAHYEQKRQEIRSKILRDIDERYQQENEKIVQNIQKRNAIIENEWEKCFARRQAAIAQRKAYWEQRNEQRRKEYEDWHDNYAAYRDTPQWKRIVHLIHTRSGGICEGCGQKSAEVVHHLTYAHVGNEFLNELVAYCYDCHDRIHEKGQYKQTM